MRFARDSQLRGPVNDGPWFQASDRPPYCRKTRTPLILVKLSLSMGKARRRGRRPQQIARSTVSGVKRRDPGPVDRGLLVPGWSPRNPAQALPAKARLVLNADRGSPRTPVYTTVTEVPVPGPVPMVCHPGWVSRFPHLRHGITTRGETETSGFDMGLFREDPGGAVAHRWTLLSQETGFERVVHGRQVHGSRVVRHGVGPAGREVVEDCDGHATAAVGTLLTVATADCVPVFLTTQDGASVALLHAGWRGTAAGVLEEGITTLEDVAGVRASALHMHLGPAICGLCYEVGPEVHTALGQPAPGGPVPIDLRHILALRGSAAGLREISISSHCTLCGDAGLFSHRGGDRGRQVAILGIAGGG